MVMEILNENERWMELPYFGGKYQISNYGKVKRSSDGYIMKPYISEKGLLKIDLHYNGVRKKFYIHRIVAEMFLPNFDNCKTVLHKNGVKTDNRIDNLELGVETRNKIKLNDNEICHVESKQYLSNKFKNGLVRKWTDETVIEASKQCKSAVEFRDRFPGAYDYAHKTDLWKTFTWLRHNTDPNKRTYVIYAYEDIVNKFVYVGLTNNIERRIKEHRKINYKNNIRKYDIVRQYFEDCCFGLPEPKILQSGINGFEAQELEDKFKMKYIEDGWNIINTGKTGKGTSSLGNLSYTYPTREECAMIVSQCKDRKEVKTKHWRVYMTIRRNGWDDLFPPRMGRQQKEDYIKLASRYKSRKDLIVNNIKLYKRIKSNGWIDEIFPSIYDGVDKDDLIEFARKYKNQTKLKENDFELYDICKDNDWLQEIFIKPTRIKYSITYDECSEIVLKYNTRKAFREYDRLAYNFAKKNGWLDSLIPINTKMWTVDSAMECASNYINKTELRENKPGCYEFLFKNKLLNEVYKTKKIRKPPLFNPGFDECLEKISLCKNLNDFRQHYTKYYNFCKRNDLIEKVIEKLKQVNPQYELNVKKFGVKDKEIIKIKCLETAKKCKTKYEFRTNYRSEYYSARDNGWLKSYIWLESCKGIKDEEKKNKAIEVAKQCITKREFREEHPVEYALAAKYKILKEFTWLKGCKKVE